MTGRAIRYIFCSVPIAIGTSQKDAAAIPNAKTAVINNNMNYNSNKKTIK